MKITRKEFIKIAEEMYDDGTFYSEKYSGQEWSKNNWPKLSDDSALVYKILDAHIRFLRTIDEYNGITREDELGHVGVLRSCPPSDRFKKIKS